MIRIISRIYLRYAIRYGTYRDVRHALYFMRLAK